MSRQLDALLRRRLLIVSGKGGCGKTSLVAALGMLAARAGIRVAVVELTRDPSLLGRLVPSPPLPGGTPAHEPRPLGGGLHHLRIVPENALDEYLESQLHAPRVARRIVEHPWMRRMLDAAPGWRDLITLGKLWHLTTRSAAGRPRWPLLIVDAPATGHGLSLISGPGAVAEMIRGGPLRRHVDAVLALLRDPERTLLVPVTLAEELAVNEVLELRRGAAALGISTATVIANGIEPALADAPGLLAAIARLPCPAAHPLIEPGALRQVVEERVALRALQQAQLQRLVSATGEAPLEIPHLDHGIEGPQGSEALADALVRSAAAADPLA